MTVAGAAGWRRERAPAGSGPPAALPHSSGLGGPRNGTSSRALPLPPLLSRPAIAALSSPSPRNQSFRLRSWTCGRIRQFPHPRPLRARSGESGGARVPGAGQRRAEQLALLTCRRISSSGLLGLQYPWRGLAGRSVEPFAGSGLTRRGATRARLRVRGRAPARSLP